jgi:hypothetical protein
MMFLMASLAMEQEEGKVKLQTKWKCRLEKTQIEKKS